MICFFTADRQLKFQPTHFGDLNPNALKNSSSNPGARTVRSWQPGVRNRTEDVSVSIRSELAFFLGGLTLDVPTTAARGTKGSDGVDPPCLSRSHRVGCLAPHGQSAR